MSKNKNKLSLKHNKITNNKLMYIIQDLIQIEDRLFQFQRRCLNCIKEKCLKVETHIDSLMKSDIKKDLFLFPILKDLPNILRKLQVKINKCSVDKDFMKLSQNVRKIRKDLIHNYFNSDKTINFNKLKNIVNHKCPRKIMPVLDPAFNIREVVKNILLLEDHLLDPERRCLDCIFKHQMIIEGFLEEAMTIDKKYKYIKLLKNYPKKMRIIQSLILEGRKNYFDIAMKLKEIRKPLMKIAIQFVHKCV